jgi:hypothetical protein
LRPYGVRALFRKVIGLALAVAGIAIVIDSLPGYIWILLLGGALIWAGWSVFRMERIY